MKPFGSRGLAAIFVLTGLIAFTANDVPIQAQPKKGPPPIPASPQAPSINFPSPSGAERGKPVELTITGTNLTDPIAVWTSFPAKVTIPTDMNNGKDASKFRVKLEVPADAPIGFHTLRVATKNGISNAQVFCVDELPQVAEVETNQAKSTAQPIPIPCVVMGRAEVEKSDFFKFSAKAGQRLTFEVLGRRLGSLFDPIVLLYEAKSGRVLPGLYYSDDAPGLQSDSRLIYAFSEAGDYIVEIRDTTFRGGPDYFYRLRIGDFPSALTAIPVAMKRGTKMKVGFTGPGAESVEPVEVSAPTDPTKTVIYVAPKGKSGLSGWPVPITLTDIDEFVEVEPNNDMSKANKLPVPSGVTGRFLEKGDVDFFSFEAKKGVKYVIAAETYEINSPAEVYLILKNARKVELGKSVPSAPSARIEFTAVEDGPLFVQAEQLNFDNGPNEVYHLTISTPEPDFDVSAGIDRIDMTPGGTGLLPITVVTRRDFKGPIELRIIGNSGLSGSVIIPDKQPQAGAIVAYLPVTANANVPPGAYEFKVEAKGKEKGKDIVRLASVADIVKQRMANLVFPPRETLTSLGAGVLEKPLFALAAKMPLPELVRGKPANITISANRAMGFAEEITLSAVNLPANVTASLKPIAKGSNEVQVQITAAAGATVETFPLFLRGAAKSGGKEFAYYSNAILLAIIADKNPAKKDDKKAAAKDEKKP